MKFSSLVSASRGRGNIKNIYIAIVACALFVTTGCSMFISTPRVARIQIHGMNNQLDEYLVVLDMEPKENMIDIQINDRYTINLDFQSLFGSTAEYDTSDTEEQQPPFDLTAVPWMMFTYKF